MIVRYTPYGKKELILLGIIDLLFLVVLWLLFPRVGPPFKIPVSLFILVCGFILSLFFRDPERQFPEDEGLILSPADGIVVDLLELSPGSVPGFDTVGVLRIGIFLSIYDVHINRAPCGLRVREVLYRRGKHKTARNPNSSSENESCTVVGVARAGGEGFPLAIKQISGAVARRIVCTARPDEDLGRGYAYGMIKFGSRTELFLPLEFRNGILVGVGDKVKAGLSPLARIVKESRT